MGGAVREVTSTSDELASLASGFGDISGQLGAIADGFDSIDEFKDSVATVGEGIKGLFSGEKGSGKKIFQGLSGMAGAAFISPKININPLTFRPQYANI